MSQNRGSDAIASNPAMRKKLRVAAIQLEGRIGDLDHNLTQVELLIGAALDKRPDVIALPEFFTTPIAYDRCLHSCSLPPDNPALDLLRIIARRHGVLIGGSYLEHRGEDVFNTYVMVEPNGSVHRHDKDQPTMVENAFYRGGYDDGVFPTEVGRVGAAMCWELLRTRTVRRLQGRVDFLMTGSHWWSPPRGWLVLGGFMDQMQAQNEIYMHETPGTFARFVGAPLVHAAQVGTLNRPLSLVPGGWMKLPFKSLLMGETQITDRDGFVIARRTREEGAGVLFGVVEPGARETALPVPERFWIPDLTKRFRFFWSHQNWVSKPEYVRAKARKELRMARISSRPLLLGNLAVAAVEGLGLRETQ